MILNVLYFNLMQSHNSRAFFQRSLVISFEARNKRRIYKYNLLVKLEYLVNIGFGTYTYVHKIVSKPNIYGKETFFLWKQSY